MKQVDRKSKLLLYGLATGVTVGGTASADVTSLVRSGDGFPMVVTKDDSPAPLRLNTLSMGIVMNVSVSPFNEANNEVYFDSTSLYTPGTYFHAENEVPGLQPGGQYMGFLCGKKVDDSLTGLGGEGETFLNAVYHEAPKFADKEGQRGYIGLQFTGPDTSVYYGYLDVKVVEDASKDPAEYTFTIYGGKVETTPGKAITPPEGSSCGSVLDFLPAIISGENEN